MILEQRSNDDQRRAVRPFALVIAVAIAIPQAVAQTDLPRIGWLSNGADGGYEDQALDQGLRDLGVVDGRTVKILHHSSGGDESRLRQMAEELARLRVALILAPDPPSVAAARRATVTIPIVMRVSNDPVGSGLVASLAHPGGNVTGIYSNADELVGKRLEILRESIPGLKRVAVLWDPGFGGSRRWFAEAQRAALAMGIQILSVETTGDKPDFEAAIRTAGAGKAQGVLTLRNPRIVAGTHEIATQAAKHRLPAISDDQRFVQVGGLMSYGADLRDLHRHLASYADRILKGARPQDLPVQQPTKFEFVVNTKTAKAIGITIPQSVLLRADRVIE